MQKATLKASIIRVIGPRMIGVLKQSLGFARFDEVDLVYAAFCEITRTGTMVDVGAHHGSSLGRFAADGWRVLAFEPDNHNRAVLQIAHGHRGNLSIDKRAVAATAAHGKPFYASKVSSGISGLSAFHVSHQQRQHVDVTTLSEVLPAYGIQHVDFLKIDTEGHDLFVLKGMDWDALKPSVIVCEFENRKTIPLGYNTADLVAYLAERGYRVTISEWMPIVEYGISHTWKGFAVDISSLDDNAWGNLIAYLPDTPIARSLPRQIHAKQDRV